MNKRVCVTLAVALMLAAVPVLSAPPRYALTPMGHLGGGESQAYAVNEWCQVVGHSRDASGNSSAFIWQSGVLTNLAEGWSSRALDINNAGQVV